MGQIPHSRERILVIDNFGAWKLQVSLGSWKYSKSPWMLCFEYAVKTVGQKCPTRISTNCIDPRLVSGTWHRMRVLSNDFEVVTFCSLCVSIWQCFLPFLWCEPFAAILIAHGTQGHSREFVLGGSIREARRTKTQGRRTRAEKRFWGGGTEPILHQLGTGVWGSAVRSFSGVRACKTLAMVTCFY